jgi:hypothetical protein
MSIALAAPVQAADMKMRLSIPILYRVVNLSLACWSPLCHAS